MLTLQETEQKYGSRIILRSLVGSTVHGTNVDDGQEDRDEMAIVIPRFEWIVTLGNPWEGDVYRSAVERTGNHNSKSYAGDLDLTLYSLLKWVRLALAGNPTVLIVLYSQPITATAEGRELQQMRNLFASKEAGWRIQKYLESQRKKMTGERGGKGVRREELVERYGYDTKFAMQALRLGLQGVELMTYGHLTLPMPAIRANFLKDVRTGKYTMSEVLDICRGLEADLEQAKNTAALPEKTDGRAVMDWVRDTYSEWWDMDRMERNDGW